MLLRLPSTLTTPFAITAPFNGAVLAQTPKPPKKSRRIAQPATAVAFIESSGPERPDPLLAADGAISFRGSSVEPNAILKIELSLKNVIGISLEKDSGSSFFICVLKVRPQRRHLRP